MFKSQISAVLDGFRCRKTRRKLHALDNRMLKDIGLTRTDLLLAGPIDRRKHSSN